MKPLLLLDVDGVLNPEYSPRSWAKRAGRNGWARHDITVPELLDINGEPLKVRLYLNSGHGAKLLAAAAEADAELAWASTWEHEANTYIAPRVGLPELPVYRALKRRKTVTVFEQVGKRRFVWLDDEGYVVYACQNHPRGEAVWVHASSGLQDHHLMKAVKILKGYADVPEPQ